ncbi:MAG: J domain-containing protein [Boseongicola sp.]|nr:J domain-containing protein [Boseongicola sp.]
MLTHYLVLGLAPTASPKDVRKRYLELIRSHPPSQDPKRSQQIVAAYEALKDDRSRMESSLFGIGRSGDFDLALNALLEARAGKRAAPGLKALISAEGVLDE